MDLNTPQWNNCPYNEFPQTQWLSPVLNKSILIGRGTNPGWLSGPVLPKTPSSLHPKEKTRPNVVNKKVCNAPQWTDLTLSFKVNKESNGIGTAERHEPSGQGASPGSY